MNLLAEYNGNFFKGITATSKIICDKRDVEDVNENNTYASFFPEYESDDITLIVEFPKKYKKKMKFKVKKNVIDVVDLTQDLIHRVKENNDLCIGIHTKSNSDIDFFFCYPIIKNKTIIGMLMNARPNLKRNYLDIDYLINNKHCSVSPITFENSEITVSMKRFVLHPKDISSLLYMIANSISKSNFFVLDHSLKNIKCYKIIEKISIIKKLGNEILDVSFDDFFAEKVKTCILKSFSDKNINVCYLNTFDIMLDYTKIYFDSESTPNPNNYYWCVRLNKPDTPITADSLMGF